MREQDQKEIAYYLGRLMVELRILNELLGDKHPALKQINGCGQRLFELFMSGG